MNATQSIVSATRLLALTGLVAGSAAAQFLPYGSGCPSTVGVATLYEPNDQHLESGAPYRIELSGVPATSTPVLLLGFTKYYPGIDLSFIGMTNCSLYLTGDLSLPMTYSGGRAWATIPMPALPCMRIYAQAAAFDPGANTLGAVSSNGATLVVDPVAETTLHTGTAGNSTGNVTYIDEPSLNGEPGALAFYTQNWMPNRIYNGHATGVWYSASMAKWSVFNQDLVTMPIGAAFNLLLPNSGATQFVVTATASNTFGHRIEIDHPSLNGDPGAVAFAVQNWNPNGGSGVYNDAIIGLWYNSASSRWEIFNQGFEAMPSGASFNVLVVDDHLAASLDPFTHTASAGTLVGNWTLLDHPALNSNPGASVTVTQVWNPPGSSGVYNDHAIGVWYDGNAGKWSVFNQDSSPIPLGAAFNVLIGEPNPRGEALFHTATGSNSSGNVTWLTDPLLDGDREALALVTQNYEPNNVYNDHPVGLWYDTGRAQWAVFNQDIAAMPDRASFNVLIPNSGATKFVVTASAGNTIGHRVELVHPKLDGRPEAILFATQSYNPPGLGGVYNDAVIGVWYNSTSGRWEIFNEGFESMPAGASFNVLVVDDRLAAPVPPYVHTATAANITSNWTYLDHGLLNGNPSAFVTVTQAWNPPGSSGVYNDHAVGVWYHASVGKWAIFNQDLAAMPDGASFHVMIGAGCR